LDRRNFAVGHLVSDRRQNRIQGVQVFSTAGVTDEQLHAMWYACSEISSQPDARQAGQRLSERLSEIISAPTAVFRREVSPWTLVASSPAGAGHASPPIAELEHLIPAADACYLPIGGPDHPAWTPVPLDEDLQSQSLLVLPGDWRSGPAAQWLPRFARTASMAMRLSAARQAARQGEGLAAVAYAFARKLSQISGDRVLHQFIVDAAAKTAHARLGGLSVYHAKEGAIAVSATYGYPSESVGHVRIVPGAGIIGGVFASKKPLLVRDTTRVPGLASRSRRYQTASFMAIPIVAGEDALGVVTLADRSDGRPFSRNDLAAARVITALSSLALVREQLTQLRDELAHTAAVDPLTGMFNRRYLHTRLDAELERSRRSGLPVALLMLDVDTFKSINDQMGHQTGDAVLRKVSEIVRRSVRASDVCTRYGGDEFAIVVAENAVSAAQTAERIRHRVEAFRWDALGLPGHLSVTLSIGVSIGEVGEASEGLIGQADQNLYQAKARGRNCVYPTAI
jgi:diguanylate cyclase (GGDEF)-like protein